MKSRMIKRDRKAKVIVVAGAQVRTARVSATILSSILMLVLGVGLASTAQASTAARESARTTTTTIIGFVSTPTTITVGDTVRDDVSVSPRASRTIEVQARRAGSRTWAKHQPPVRPPGPAISRRSTSPRSGCGSTGSSSRQARPPREAVSKTRTITANAPTTPPGDTTAPGPVTGLFAKADSSTDSSVALYWVNPTDADFTGVMIRRSEGAIAPAKVTDGTLVTDLIDNVPYVVDITGVNGGTQYSYSFFAHDAANNYAAAANVTYTTTGTPRDLTVPGPVTALVATAPSATSIKLAWTNPGDADFTGATIRRAVGATAPTYNSGVMVTDTAKADTSFTDTGLIAGGAYSYAVFSHDAAGNHAAAVKVTATLPVPPASVLPTAVLSFTSAGLDFDFDASGSTAVTPKTLSTGTLDYGDGTREALSGDLGWSAFHSYAAAGTFTVILTVVDSAGISATTEKIVTISGTAVPTATLTEPTAPVTVNTPVEFTLATTGSAVVFWTVQGDSVGFYSSAFGTPPGTVTHTFTDAGSYTVSFTFTNDAGQSAETSLVVVVQ